MTLDWWSDLTPSARGEEGRRRYSALPRVAPKFSHAQRAAFKASAAAAPARLRLGVAQPQRLALTIEAALSGNAAHLAALLCAGVDVDARNGYGQTALFVAAWQNRADAAAQLLRFGATHLPSGSGVEVNAVAGPAVLPLLLRSLATPSDGEAACSSSSSSSGSNIRTRLLDVLSPVEVRVVHCWAPSGGRCFVIDGGISASILNRIDASLEMCSAASARAEAEAPARHTDPGRLFFCDELGCAGAAIAAALEIARASLLRAGDEEAAAELPCGALPYMRFLVYTEAGQSLRPHTDAAKWGLTRTAGKSTHTFILFLNDCEKGGSTLFVESTKAAAAATPLAFVAPRRGRLLLFPHACPHAGETTVTVPKLLLRGECL